MVAFEPTSEGLNRRQLPLCSDQFQSALDATGPAPEADRPAPRGSGSGPRSLDLAGSIWRATWVRSRPLVGLVLVAAGVVWAIARGLHFYGVSPVHLAYDLDQPPWLLVLVSAWLWYRSRRR